MLLPSCIIIAGNEKASKIQTFNSIFLETLETVLYSLGCKHQTFYKLEEKYQISPRNLSDNIKLFANAFKEIFGDASVLIEIKIMQLLHSKVPKFRYHPQKQEITLYRYLTELKNHLGKTN